MKILITGAGGYVGSHLFEMLVRDGYEAIPIFSSRNKEESDLKLDLTSKEIIKKLAALDFDIILHAAARIPGINGVLDDEILEQNNILIDENIAQLANAKSAFVIYLSTCGLYRGDLPCVKDEMSDIDSLTPYFNSKLIGEKIIMNCKRSCILRLSSPYLIDSLPKNVLFHFLNNLKLEGTVEVWGAGQREQDFLNLEDLFQWIKKIIELQIKGVFNAVSGLPISMFQLAKLLTQNLDGKLILQPHRNEEFRFSRYCQNKIIQATNIKPKNIFDSLKCLI